MNLMRQTHVIEQSSAKGSYLPAARTRDACISPGRFAAGLFLLDIIVLFLAGMAPALVHSGIEEGFLSQYVSVCAGSVVLFLLVARALNIYDVDQIFDWVWIVPRVILSLLATFLLVISAGLATKTFGEYSRVWFFSWSLCSLLALVALRVFMLATVEAKLARGACLKRALVVTCSDGTLTDTQLALETRNRVRAIAIVTAHDLEHIPDLIPYIQALKPEMIIVNLPWAQVEDAIEKFNALSHYALEVLILPEASVCFQKAVRLRRLGTRTLVQIIEPPLAPSDRALKRVEDVIVSSLAILVAMPLLLLVAIAIKLESRGPVLFKQVRVGLDGDIFEVWKFRSMYAEDADLHASQQTRKDDPRVTRLGRFMRRTSIDELPQFWNVLQGQMSVVGPRPHALKTMAEGERLEAITDQYVARHRVKPGITGWAQVNGARGELSSREQVRRRVDYDLHYIENWSLFFDIKIILMTIIKIFYDPHAY